jgi:hypothetical protein
MCLLRWTLLLLFLLPATGHAQRRGEKERNWEFHADAWLLWNTVHGDRYVPYVPPPPTIPLRDLDFTRTRSFARNSCSSAFGIMVERHLYSGLWIATGIEFIERKSKYVFHQDTLAIYPPFAPPPDGLYFQRIADRTFWLAIPILFKYRFGNWSLAAGMNFTKESLRSKGVGMLLDGSRVTLYDNGPRNSSLLGSAIPRAVFGWNGLGKQQRFQFMLGGDIRKTYGANRRWVDVRFGGSVRIGKL